MSNQMETVRKELIELYNQKNYLSEDEIVDICIDHNLSEIQIMQMCDILQSDKVIITDTNSRNETECKNAEFIKMVKNQYSFQKAERIVNAYFSICEFIRNSEETSIRLFESNQSEVEQFIMGSYLPTIRSNAKKQMIREFLRAYDKFILMQIRNKLFEEDIVVAPLKIQNEEIGEKKAETEKIIETEEGLLETKKNVGTEEKSGEGEGKDIGEKLDRFEEEFIETVRRRYNRPRAQRILQGFSNIRRLLSQELGSDIHFSEENFTSLLHIAKSESVFEKMDFANKQYSRDFFREFRRYLSAIKQQENIEYVSASVSNVENLTSKIIMRNCKKESPLDINNIHNTEASSPIESSDSEVMSNEEDFILQEYYKWLIKNGFLERIAKMHIQIMKEYHKFCIEDNVKSPLCISDINELRQLFKEDTVYNQRLASEYGKTKINATQKYYVNYIAQSRKLSKQ